MTLTSGTVVGDRYCVKALRAHGASGSVYRAEHEGLHKVVALKVVHERFANSVLVGRFFREARILTTLDHPNVVRALDVGVDSAAGAYMALEYVEGEDLETRLLREPKLDIAEALRIARDIAAGVAAVHAARIIHRDLKPANVLIDRETGRAKVTDFGVARIRDDLRQRDINGGVTEFEMAVGTPQYMAPEQVASPHEVDERTDIFALGAILYEMLTGKPAFDTPRLERLMRDVLLRRAPSLADSGIAFPPNIVNLVDTMLRPAPEHRLQSIQEVARALDNVFAVRRSVPPPALVIPPLVEPSAPRLDSIQLRPASSFPPVTDPDEHALTERSPFATGSVPIIPAHEGAEGSKSRKRFSGSAYVAMGLLALGGFALGRTTLPRASATDHPHGFVAPVDPRPPVAVEAASAQTTGAASSVPLPHADGGAAKNVRILPE